VGRFFAFWGSGRAGWPSAVPSRDHVAVAVAVAVKDHVDAYDQVNAHGVIVGPDVVVILIVEEPLKWLAENANPGTRGAASRRKHRWFSLG
jgi:hypothetical protein